MKQQIATIVNDMITGVVSGQAVGVEIPDNLSVLSYDLLRFDGNNIIDARLETSFFIDIFGKKHIVRHDLGWQPLNCAFTDYLINDGGVWRVKTSTDSMIENKTQAEQSMQSSRNAAMFILLSSAALGDGHDYSINPENNNFLNNLITLGNGSKFTCTDSNGVKARLMHTHEQLMTLATNIEAHISAQFDIYETKLAEIEAATDQAELDAVIW